MVRSAPGGPQLRRVFIKRQARDIRSPPIAAEKPISPDVAEGPKRKKFRCSSAWGRPSSALHDTALL